MTHKKNIIVQEQESWLHSVEHLLHQCATMKVSIASITISELDQQQLESLELFHSKFIESEALLKLIKRDILFQIDSNNNLGSKDLKTKHFLSKQEVLRSDVEKLEKKISSLKFDFYNTFKGFVNLV